MLFLLLNADITRLLVSLGPCISDIILVIIGFYVGDEKADDGRLPFNILGTVVAGTMILSEVC